MGATEDEDEAQVDGVDVELRPGPQAERQTARLAALVDTSSSRRVPDVPTGADGGVCAAAIQASPFCCGGVLRAVCEKNTRLMVRRRKHCVCQFLTPILAVAVMAWVGTMAADRFGDAMASRGGGFTLPARPSPFLY